MKVLNKITVKEDWRREFRCNGNGFESDKKGCKAVLLVGEGDLFLYSRRGGGLWVTDIYICFTCPKCHQKTDVTRLLTRIPPEELRRIPPDLPQIKILGKGNDPYK